MQYDDRTAEKLKQVARDTMDECQSKIDQLNALSGGSRLTTGKNLLEWQAWIGNISFVLVAIVGSVLIGKELPNSYVLVSLLIFLITGLWIALFQKRIYEQAAIHASKEADEYRPLYDDKKKAAWIFYQDPRSIEKHLKLLGLELNITKLTKKIEFEQQKAIGKDRIDYRNDIWLAMLVTAIYLLLWSVGSKIYSSLGWMQSYYPYLFWSVWLLFMLVISKSALSSEDDIKASNTSMRLKLKSQIKHTKEWLQQVQEQIDDLESRLS